MLFVGILFAILGIYTISSERYKLKDVGDKREIVKKEVVEKDGFYKYKILLGIFAIVLGIFNILNYIIY